MTFESLRVLKEALGAAHRVIGIPEGTDARAVEADGADAFAADVILRVEARCRERRRRAPNRVEDEPFARLAGLIVLVVVPTPVEDSVTRLEAAADIGFGLLDHVNGEDWTHPVRRLVQNGAAVDLHDFAGELPRR